MTPGGSRNWASSTTSRRVTPLPGGWKAIREACLRRDGYQCTVVERDIRCPATTQLEADHLGDPEDHSLDNLATKCNWHHAKKTGRDASIARWSKARQQKPRHPGMLP